MSRPTAAEAPAWKCGNEFAPYHPHASHISPDYRDGWNHCYREAQAALDKLTAERDDARASLEALVDLVAESDDQLRQERDEARAEAKEIRSRWNDAENEFSALKASPAVNVDEAMRLADEYANATYHRDGNHGAAREALRAYLGGKP